VRAASGGLLFGVPLLYTVEVMWTGQHTNPKQSLTMICACVALLIALNRTSGFRSTADTTLRDAALDAVEGVALAIVLVVATLTLLGEIDASQPLAVVLGKTAYEVLPVSIGIGVANNILRERPADDSSQGEAGASSESTSGESPSLDTTVADLGANTLGAVFVALSIAPTDEVPMMAASQSPLALLAIMAATIAVAYAIVFVAGFTGQSRRRSTTGLLQHPVIETMACYVIALLTSYVLLALFQRADAPWPVLLAQVVVLAFPAAIGGAAGRLAL
jgi:putative integral membrane protein (TIGR02587 family)